MAAITLEKIKHSYAPDQSEIALQELDLTWEDGGAYALLGPSGCGKTTLLNIISGLLQPTFGRLLFDQEDVTDLLPEHRHIAQVFQFPVIYDTMTVYDNLAFPLRNRKVSEDQVRQRVLHIAELLNLTTSLNNRAVGLSADGKQKVSLGRGLVRTDVNAILFDEPLTVIDPHLKYQLRSHLKQLHQQVNNTMIYVTHDQVEALNFADRVVVMNMGEVLQIGTPKELFEFPQHVFVGFFIGSPGMNMLECTLENGQAVVAGKAVATSNQATSDANNNTQLGVRPEFIRFADDGETGIPAKVCSIRDAGRFFIIETDCAGQTVKLLLDHGKPVPENEVQLIFDPVFTHIYQDGWLC